MEEIAKDRLFFEQSGGGITFSGGEPLYQHHFLLNMLTACKHRGFHTAVDTSGFAPGSILKKVAECTDLFLYDLKMLDEKKHVHYIGASNRLLLRNLLLLDNWQKRVLIRIPVIPSINDGLEDWTQLKRFLAKLKYSCRVVLLPYHKTGIHKYLQLGYAYRLTAIEPPSPARLAELADGLKPYVENVEIGG